MSNAKNSSLWTATLKNTERQKESQVKAATISSSIAKNAFDQQPDENHTLKKVSEDNFGYFLRISL